VSVIPPGEHDLVSGRARLLNDRGANTLAAAGNQETSALHLTIMASVPSTSHSEVHLYA
jgi:hypothetical protein